MCSYNFLSAILTFLAKFHERWIMQTMDFSPEINNIRKTNITTLNMDSRLYFWNLNATLRKMLTPILKIYTANTSELCPLVCLVPNTQRCNSCNFIFYLTNYTGKLESFAPFSTTHFSRPFWNVISNLCSFSIFLSGLLIWGILLQLTK